MQAGPGVMPQAPAAGTPSAPVRAVELVAACAILLVAAVHDDGAGDGSARGSATAACLSAAPVFAVVLVAPRAALAFAAFNVDGAFEGRARGAAAAAGQSAASVCPVVLVACVSVAEHAIVAGRPGSPCAGRGHSARRADPCGIRFGRVLFAEGAGPARSARPRLA